MKRNRSSEKALIYHFLLVLIAFMFNSKIHGDENTILSRTEQNTISLSSETTVMNLGNRISYLVDTRGKLNINDLQNSEIQNQFLATSTDTPNFGFRKEVYWFKIHIQNLTDKKDWILEIRNPYLAHLKLYVPKEDGSYLEKPTGEQELITTREVLYRHFVFKAPVPVSEKSIFYLRVSTNAILELPLFIWEADHFQETIRSEAYILGIYFGFLLVMILYNFSLFLSTKEKTYAFYTGYVFFFLLVQMSLNGFAQIHVWPDMLLWEKYSFPIIAIFFLLFLILFSVDFLQSATNTPKLFFVMRILGYLELIMIPVSLIIDVRHSIPILAFLVSITLVVIFASAVFCLKRARPARFFLFAYFAFIIGGLVNIMRVFGFLPSNFFTIWGQQIGSAMEVVLLSLGLADKINFMKKEQEEQQKKIILNNERLAQAFGRFVPLEFLSFLDRNDISNVELGDHVEKEMTILFCDIRSFTEMSEGMTPEENFKFLNSYFKRMNPIIRKNKGFIDKLIGDAIMALFPFSPDHAIRAAIEMQKELRIYNQHRTRSGYDMVSIGIGLHTGKLILGTIGSPERMDSTVISDSVNLASRIEGLTKKYGCSLLISEKTLQKLSDPFRYNYRIIDRVRVKGKKETVAVFHVFDGLSEYLFDLFDKTKGDFERGINCYINKDYPTGIAYFQKVIEVNPMDKAAELYVQRGLMRALG